MSTSTCTISQNQPIYQALIAKAASYPTDKTYRIAAYNCAAKSVLTWNYNLYTEFLPAVPSFGPSITSFVQEFIKMNPTTNTVSNAGSAVNTVRKAILEAPIDHPLTAQEIADIIKVELKPKDATPDVIKKSVTLVAANQSIYQALLDKAASYPADKPYQAKAYKKAAEIIRTCKTDIYALVKKCNSKWDFDDDFEDEELDIGSSVATFIYKYAKENPLPQPTGSFISSPIQRQTAIGGAAIGPLCAVPANQPIYYALIRKAETYPDQGSFNAKAYRKAAESVLTFEDDIVAGVAKYEDYWSMQNYVPNVGAKIANYITSIVIGIKDTATTTTTTTPPTTAMPSAELRKVVASANIETLKQNAQETAFNARVAALNAREAALNVRELQIKIKEAEAAAATATAAANAAEKALTNA